jgi:hypothetical protein
MFEEKTLDTNEITEKLPDIEVVEIYPDLENPKSGTREKGTVHISIKDLGIDIRNIMYIINNKGVIHVLGPGRSYRKLKDPESKEKPKVTVVPTIKFHNEAIWKHIQNVIQKEIKELSDG